MDLADLQTFRAVVDHGGVTAAARHLHRVQSSISARLGNLERNLGCLLFERAGKSLRLTPEGRHLYERSGGIVREMEGLRDEIAHGTPAAVLRVGAMESTAAVRLPQPLAQLRQQHPRMQIVLRTGTTGALLALLERGEIDAAFVAGPNEREGLDFRRAFTEELVLIAPQGSRELPATLVTFSTGCAYREVARAWAREKGHALAGAVEIGSYHALVACVSAGMGAALVPRSVLERVDASAVQVARIGRSHARQVTWLATRSGSASQALAALRAAVQA